MSIPRGIKNRNPLNVRQPDDDTWDGSVSTEPINNEAIFCHEIFGFRAACKDLAAYQLKHGCDSVLKIIQRWAECGDTQGSIAGNPANDPIAYAAFIEKKTGIITSRPLALFDGEGKVTSSGNLISIMAAMVEWEQGAGIVYPVEFIKSGIALYAHDH